MKAILLSLLILICNMTVFPHAGLAQNSRPMVRLIYFLPNDREPQPDINAKMDILIKDVQQFYADQMAAHGFGRKTFQIETNARGNAMVHRVSGRFTDKHYMNLSDTSDDIIEEVEGRFDLSRNIYFIVIDISSGLIISNGDEVCGVAVSTVALIPASRPCFNLRVAGHELGHAFGLHHDFRNNSYLMSYGKRKDKLSQCAAEVLNVHPAFNLARSGLDTEKTTIEILPPRFAFAPAAIRLRFKVSDPDGLYQAQALVMGDVSEELLGYKQLNGNTRSTFEIITTYLFPRHQETTIHLQVIDMEGNIHNSEPYPINVIDLFPPAKVVTMPDENLAAAVQETLKLAPGTPLTTHMMFELVGLTIVITHWAKRIKDITGLEHCNNLIHLEIQYSSISDVSPLARLTQLEYLDISSTISDISPWQDSQISSIWRLRAISVIYPPW